MISSSVNILKTSKYKFGVLQVQSYQMGRRYLFRLGWLQCCDDINENAVLNRCLLALTSLARQNIEYEILHSKNRLKGLSTGCTAKLSLFLSVMLKITK